MSKNLLKLKIENIAKSLLNKNKFHLSDNNEYLKTNINNNLLSSDESTIKDSISEFEDISKTLNPKNSRNLKNLKNNFISKSSVQSIINQNHHHSSLCTKMTSLSENHSGGGTLDYHQNIESNKLNNKLKNKDNHKSNGLLIKNDNNINKINLIFINNIHDIYQKLLDLFNYNKNFNNQNNLNSNDLVQKINDEIMLLSYKYINLIFCYEMETLIKIFYSNEEIQKYFLLQIYLFISLVYLFGENIITNNYLLFSYKSIFYYSLSNLEKIMNIINLPILLQNEKIIKNIKSINKIILSILKIINPKIPCNSQIIYFISPNNSIQKNKFNSKINCSGVLKLISLLKLNTKLKQKLIDIENKNTLFTKDSEISQRIDKIQSDSEKKKEAENNNIYKKINNNINKNNLITPILPKMDLTKYKYTIAMELDETLVHYCEDNDNYYAKVRFGSENFLQHISNFFEIIIVSTSGKEYSNIIIDNINKEKCYVEHRLYTEDFNDDLNLSKLNRDYKKLIFVCHNQNFLNAPKENILLLKEFNGEEEDREIIKLHNELNIMIRENDEIEDIRDFIPKIMERIQRVNYEELFEEESQNEEEEQMSNNKDK